MEQQWLADPQLPARADRSYQWRVAQSDAADALLRQWAAEDGHPDDLSRLASTPPLVRMDDA